MWFGIGLLFVSCGCWRTTWVFGLGVVGASVLVLRGLGLVGYLACVALWFEFYVAVFAIAGLRLWLDGGWFGWLLVIVVLAWFYGTLVLMFVFC